MSESLKKTVLVAEDNPIMADVLGRHLKRDGHDVTTAKNGLEALQESLARSFDLIITDFQMPKMDGEAFVREMRESGINAKTPVILLSGKGLELDTQRLRSELHITEFLFKPFSPSGLTAIVRTIFESGADATTCSATSAECGGEN